MKALTDLSVPPEHGLQQQLIAVIKDFERALHALPDEDGGKALFGPAVRRPTSERRTKDDMLKPAGLTMKNDRETRMYALGQQLANYGITRDDGH